MRRQFVALLAATLGVSLAGVASGPTASATAEPTDPTSAQGSNRSTHRTAVPTHRAIVTARQSVLDYWTPERMRNATPVPRPHVTAGELRQPAVRSASRPLVVDPVAPTVEPAAIRAATAPAARTKVIGERWRHPNTRVAATSGKVFFTSGRTDMVCSAGVITGKRKNVIVTAGHCVFGDKSQQWSENFVFVPGYDDGRAPYGRYPALRMWTTPQYFNHQSFAHDVGFVRVERYRGRQVAFRVGAQGVWFNSPGTPWAHDFGYPADAPQFHGRYLIHCAGDTTWYRSKVRKQYRLHCRMNGGASGGPWLRKYESSGLGYQFSVVSLVSFPDDHPKLNIGPYFGDAVKRVWRTANGLA